MQRILIAMEHIRDFMDQYRVSHDQVEIIMTFPTDRARYDFLNAMKTTVEPDMNLAMRGPRTWDDFTYAGMTFKVRRQEARY